MVSVQIILQLLGLTAFPASIGVVLFGGGWGLVIVMLVFVIKVGRELDLGAEPLMVPVYGIFAAAVLFYVLVIILVSLPS